MSEAVLAQRPVTGAVRPPPPAVLWVIGGAAGIGAALTLTFTLTSDHVSEPGVQAALMTWASLAYVVAGLVAWRRRPESRIGVLMLAAGCATFLASFSSSNAALPFTLGIAFDLLPAVLFLHVFLSFPSGRLQGPLEHALVTAGYVTAFGAQLVGLALDGFGPDNLVALVSAPDTAYTLLRVQLTVLAGIALAGVAVLLLRRRRAGRPARRWVALLVDSFAITLVMLAVLYLSAAFGLVSGQTAFEWIRRLTLFVLGLAPLCFLVGLLHARLARAAVAELVVDLRENPAPADLRAALARALRDPSLALVYWLPAGEAWADLEGRPVDFAARAAGRGTTLIDRDGRHVAALLHDPELEQEPELLDGVAAAAGIALENARLHADLRARLDELQGSRARIVAAGDSERRRLERNLHDGAQQRLVALSLGLRLVATQLAPDSEAERLLAGAREELAASMKELRELAQGIHPAVLTDHGLEVALDSLAARAPVPVALHVELPERLPAPIEVAAYYLVSEGLANVGKYAEASAVSVEVARRDGHLVVQVADDGIGGADPAAGSGLRGLTDRVEALGGRVQVWSPPAAGTRVRAEIPCA